MISEKKLSYIATLCLCVYFCTKMLWDTVSYNLTEYISIILIFWGMILWIKVIPKKMVPFIVLFGIFAIYIAINSIVLTDFAHLRRGLYENVFYGAIFFSSLGYFRSVKYEEIKKILKIMGYLSIILAVLTLIEYIQGVAFISVDGDVAYGTFISGYGYTFRCKVFSRSYLSHGMIMGILGLINLYLFKNEKKNKWIIFFVACIIGILLTSSRGPLVATGISTVFLGADFSALKKMQKAIFIKKILLIGVIIIIFYIVCISDFTFGDSTLDYFLTRIRNIFNWSSDAGNVGRIHRWTKYINYFTSHNMLFGSGCAVTGTSGLSTLGMGTTESGVIKRLVELGIVGTTLHYSFLSFVLLASYKRMSACKRKQVFVKLSFAVILSILIDDVTLQITEEIMVSFYLWFFSGIVFSIAYYPGWKE